mgnify:CR=1 FL=1
MGAQKLKKISRNEIVRRYSSLQKEHDFHVRFLGLLGARFFKTNPHDKIFKDGSFDEESLKSIKKTAKLDWSALDKLHGINEEDEAN